MPCAAGELCLLPDRTPVAPDGHACQGVCGGRLHGTCGSVAGDNELHRICTTCVDATSHKRKGAVEEGGGGGQAKRPNQGKGKNEQKGKGGPRKRLTLDQKLAILKLLEERVAQDEIADRYECSVRTVRAVKAAKADLEKEASTAGKGDMKTKRKEDDEDDEDEDGEEGESTGRGRGGRAPPAYGELSSHFGILEKAAAESGNGEAALFLAKARMAMIAAHAAKPARQTDLREFVARGGGTSKDQ